MKKLILEINHLISRMTGRVTIHAKCSAIKGSYSEGLRDYQGIDFRHNKYQ